jgi:hypothetical protein
MSHQNRWEDWNINPADAKHAVRMINGWTESTSGSTFVDRLRVPFVYIFRVIIRNSMPLLQRPLHPLKSMITFV